MFKRGDHNSFMILGLANTLVNSGVLDKTTHKEIFELGYLIERHHMIDNANKLLKEIDEILNKE